MIQKLKVLALALLAATAASLFFVHPTIARVNNATTLTNITNPDLFCVGGTNQGTSNPNTELCIDWNGWLIPTGSTSASPTQQVGSSAHPFADVESAALNAGGGTLTMSGPMGFDAPAIQMLVAGSTITAACGGTTLVGATGAVTLNAATPIAAPVGLAQCNTNLLNGSTGAATITMPGVAALPAATGAIEWAGATGTQAMPVGDTHDCTWNVSLGKYWSCR